MAYKRADWIRLILGLALVIGGMVVVAHRVQDRDTPSQEPDEPLYRTEWYDDGTLKVTGRTSLEEGLEANLEKGDQLLFLTGLARARMETVEQTWQKSASPT